MGSNLISRLLRQYYEDENDTSSKCLLRKREARYLRRIWTYHIEPIRERFFNQSLHHVLDKSSEIRQVLGIDQRDYSDDPDITKYLLHVSNKVLVFIKSCYLQLKSGDFDGARENAQELGARRCHFGVGHSFHPIYWDIFVLSMTESLERQSVVSPKDMYIWQKFVRQIVEWMKEGHDREASKINHCDRRESKTSGTSKTSGASRTSISRDLLPSWAQSFMPERVINESF